MLMLLVAAAGLAAQSVPVGGPVAGAVFDGHARAIRPMLGAPGGSYLGDALAGSIDLAGISPDGKLALAAADGNLFLLRGLDTGAPTWIRLAQAAANPDRIAWNRTSTAAAVCSGGRLRLWRDLDETPPATVEPDSNPRAASRRLRSGAKLTPRATDLGDLSALGGRVTVLAVDAAGAVLAGVEDAEAGGLYRLSSEGEPVLLARMTSPGGIVFANADSGLFVTDRGRQEILEIRDFRDGADVVLFANRNRGVCDPVAVALSRDGKTLLVASGSGRNLTRYDVQSRSLIDQIDLDFEPSRLAPLPGGSLYLLNSRGGRDEVLRVLEEGPNPAVYFGPAASAAVVAELNPVEE